jgi:hypothetical protein
VKSALLSAFALVLASTCAQTARAEGIPIARYLLTAKEDGSLKARHADKELAFKSYPGLPLLRDMEFRVRNDALDPANMRYSLRVEPRAFGEGSASRRHNEVGVARSRKRSLLLLNRALLDRYLLAIDNMMLKAVHRVNEEMIGVSEDRIRVLEKMKSTEDFDLGDLIEAEVDLTKLKSQDLDVQKDIAVLEEKIGLHLGAAPADPGFDTSGMVSVDSIIAQVEKGGYALDTGHVYLDYLKLSLSLAETRYRLEKAEGRQYLSFLSFSYDVGERLNELERRGDGKDYDLGRAYILEAGFRLPSLTTGNQDLNRRKEEFLSEKEDYHSSRRELEDIMRKDIRDIHSLVKQYRYLKARENEVDAQASLKKYMQLSGVDPLVLLSIKSGNLRNRLKLEEVKYGIIMNWIKVLDAAGQLSREPLRNHLAAGSPELAP